MRAERGRTKKLILAFHFQFSDQAGWKCGSCRNLGLEKKRRCLLAGAQEEGPERVVWARKGVAASRCPKSIITAESLALLEEYCAWKLAGQSDYRNMGARQAEAFWVLEQELAKERVNRE